MKQGFKTVLILSCIAVLVLLSAHNIALAQPTYKSGEINGHETWTIEESPYIVTGALIVTEGAFLSINPGVNVRFRSGTFMEIYGIISVYGSRSEPVVFESDVENSSWGGLRFISANQGYLHFAEFSGSCTAMRLDNSQLEMSNSKITVQSEDTNNTNIYGIFARPGSIVDFDSIEVNVTASMTDVIAVELQDCVVEISNSFFNLNITGEAQAAGTAVKLYRCNSGIITGSTIRARSINSVINGLHLYKCTLMNLKNNAIQLISLSESESYAVKADLIYEEYPLMLDHFAIDLVAGGENAHMAGVWVSDGAMTLTNSIVANRKGKLEHFNVVFLAEEVEDTLFMSYCDLYNVLIPDYDNLVYDDATIILSRPNWVDPDSLDFHLLESSGCIDAGDPEYEMDDDGRFHIEDEDDPLDDWYEGTVTDIGMYYYHQHIPVPNDNTSIDPDYSSKLPESFEISSVYPNPFNNTTRIEISLAKSSLLDVGIYNVNGRLVSQITSENYPAGRIQLTWNGFSDYGELSSGLYFVRARSDNKMITRKIVLLQ